uniref:NADH-ubiquinone oxidoreductase chain 5 n=1 Tax=Megalothorax incertus TaxID=2579793 RepID=A0A8E8L9E9_9HEXA|nr:NADH dehydrogenase subunit 5 [Megalothorax incertus]
MSAAGLISFYVGVLTGSVGVVSLLSGLWVEMNSSVWIAEWLIFSIWGVDIVFLGLVDWLSLAFIGVVALISGMVMIYSGYYMGADLSFGRFIFLVFMFVLSMFFMILSPNMISILLGWDGLGLVSYCLVIYYQNAKSANSGMITILSNRIGDVAILLSISLLAILGDWGVGWLLMWEEEFWGPMLMGLIILAAITKSAQVPFSAWLPAAMAAPTPVSALVHSSTLVTAGVYLLIRFSSILGCSEVLLGLSFLTMLVSGLGACFEKDMKSVIAFSTLSQLGVMMFALSLGLVELAFFHLLSHALFKSLLFLCAGLYIHGGVDQQDTRGIGQQLNSMPIISCYMLAANLALAGFPFMSGFYSKDLIIEVTEFAGMGVGFYYLMMLAILSTGVYSIRLVYYQYMGELGTKPSLVGGEEAALSFLPMGLLYLGALVGGSVLSWAYIPLLYSGLSVWGFLSLLVGVAASGLLVATLWTKFWFNSILRVSYFSSGLGSMWFMYFLSSFPAAATLRFGGKILKMVDQGWAEYYGSQGAYQQILRVSSVGGLGVELSVGVLLMGIFLMVAFVSLS